MQLTTTTALLVSVVTTLSELLRQKYLCVLLCSQLAETWSGEKREGLHLPFSLLLYLHTNHKYHSWPREKFKVQPHVIPIQYPLPNWIEECILSWSDRLPLLHRYHHCSTGIPTTPQVSPLLHQYPHYSTGIPTTPPVSPLLHRYPHYSTGIPTTPPVSPLLHRYPHYSTGIPTTPQVSPLLHRYPHYSTGIPTTPQVSPLLHRYPHYSTGIPTTPQVATTSQLVGPGSYLLGNYDLKYIIILSMINML